jgi:hypothetical protein
MWMGDRPQPALDFRPEYQPTEKDLESPAFNAIWNAIKKWDIQKDEGQGYSNATGTHVMYIIRSLREIGVEI